MATFVLPVYGTPTLTISSETLLWISSMAMEAVIRSTDMTGRTGFSGETETTGCGAAAIRMSCMAMPATMSYGAAMEQISFAEEMGTTFCMATRARMFCTATLATMPSMAETRTEFSTAAPETIGSTEVGMRIILSAEPGTICFLGRQATIPCQAERVTTGSSVVKATTPSSLERRLMLRQT